MAELNRSAQLLAVASGALALGACAIARAQAQPAPVPWEVELSAPADSGCATTAELLERIARRVGAERRSSGEAPRVHIELREEGSHAGWSARVRALDRGGRTLGMRQLRTREEDCRTLDVALVLVVSAVLGVERSTQLQPPEPQPEPEAEPKPAPPRAEPVVYRIDIAPPPAAPSGGALLFSLPRREPAGEPWHLQLGVTARAVSGLVPGTAAAIGAGVSAHSGGLQLAAGALLLPASQARVGTAAQTRFGAALGEVAACTIAARPGEGTVAFCAGAQAGAVWGHARGLWMQKSSRELVVLAVPSFRTQLPLSSWLSLQGSVGAAFPLRSAAYSYIDASGQRRRFHGVQMGLWAELGAALRLAR